MSFGENTVKILKNFSTINKSILFTPGKTLRTISATKTTLAKASIEEEIERRFAIYDLPKFLQVIDMFNNPKFDFREKFVTISDQNQSIKYVYADEQAINIPPEKDIVIPDIIIDFQINSDHLAQILKAVNTLGLPSIAITGNGENILLQALDTTVKSSSNEDPTNVYSLNVGTTDKEFRAIIKPEYLRFLPMDYTIEISGKGITKWYNDMVSYWVPTETK